MGPLATVDFLAKLVARRQRRTTRTTCPSSQRRSRRFRRASRRSSPVERARSRRSSMRATACSRRGDAARDALQHGHRWHDDLARGIDVPFLHIADAATEDVAANVPAGATVGVIATGATHAIGLYSARLERAGYRVAVPVDAGDLQAVADGIAAVKRGRRRRADAASRASSRAGAQGGGRDRAGLHRGSARGWPPLASDRRPWVDPTDALARACVAAWARARSAGNGRR